MLSSKAGLAERSAPSTTTAESTHYLIWLLAYESRLSRACRRLRYQVARLIPSTSHGLARSTPFSSTSTRGCAEYRRTVRSEMFKAFAIAFASPPSDLAAATSVSVSLARLGRFARPDWIFENPQVSNLRQVQRAADFAIERTALWGRGLANSPLKAEATPVRHASQRSNVSPASLRGTTARYAYWRSLSKRSQFRLSPADPKLVANGRTSLWSKKPKRYVSSYGCPQCHVDLQLGCDGFFANRFAYARSALRRRIMPRSTAAANSIGAHRCLSESPTGVARA